MHTLLTFVGGMLACLAMGRAQDAAETRTLATLEPDLEIAGLRIAELDAQPGVELVLLGTHGEVVVYGWEAATAKLRPLGEALVLPDPEHSLVAIGERLGGGGKALFVVASEGTRVHEWGEAGAFDRKGSPVAPRARFALSMGRPMFAPILSDVDGDGTAELLVPDVAACEIWRAEHEVATDPPKDRWLLRRDARVALRAQHDESATVEALSDELEASFSIPGVLMRDVNGDGRDDLFVVTGNVHAFHLQREDGGFPAEPDARVDLALFRDNAPASEIAPGEILAASDQDAMLVSEDLDGDAILDHVITHRRKVWIFRGGAAGPQFSEPARILRATEDVTAALLFDVDADGRPDLVLLKVRLPQIGEIVLALVSSWEVGAHVVGYRNLGDCELGTGPEWERDLTLELPPILDVLRKPQQWIARFKDLGESLRTPIAADFDGDGTIEIVLPRPKEGDLALWRTKEAEDKAALDEDGGAFLRELFFKSERTSWSIEALMGVLADRAAARLAEWTQGRAPDARIPLRPAAEWLWLERWPPTSTAMGGWSSSWRRNRAPARGTQSSSYCGRERSRSRNRYVNKPLAARVVDWVTSTSHTATRRPRCTIRARATTSPAPRSAGRRKFSLNSMLVSVRSGGKSAHRRKTAAESASVARMPPWTTLSICKRSARTGIARVVSSLECSMRRNPRLPASGIPATKASKDIAMPETLTGLARGLSRAWQPRPGSTRRARR